MLDNVFSEISQIQPKFNGLVLVDDQPFHKPT